MAKIRHPAQRPSESLIKECQVTRTRRGGPGGQHRNKVETAIVLRHLPTGVEAEANERRSQAENQRVALERLRLNLALEIRCSAVETPSHLWRSRCSGGRIRVRRDHPDACVLIAELLDVLAERDWDLKASSDHLFATSSQLVKLLKLEPRALSQLNVQRNNRNLSRLT